MIRPSWTRFALRTFVIVVVLLSMSVGYYVIWLRQRHDIKRKMIYENHYSADGEMVRAPGLLWLFGEPGYSVLYFEIAQERESRPLTVCEQQEIKRVKRLFPEALEVSAGVSWPKEEN